MSTRHSGPWAGSAWSPETFDGATVRLLAEQAAPDYPLAADASEIADRMNEAAHSSLLSLKLHATPKDAEKWAEHLAEACSALIKAVGPLPTRTAMRLRFVSEEDFRQFTDMLEAVRNVRSAAFLESVTAAAAKGTTTVARPPAENMWLTEMVKIFETGFARRAGITKDVQYARGGPCSRFISGAAKQLLADPKIRDVPEGWRTALTRFSTEKTVAGRLESMRGSQEAQP